MPSCEGCGACCEYMLIRFQGRMPADYAEARDIRVMGPFMAFPMRCKHLKEGKCAIYESRPAQCKEFKVGCLECLLCRRLKGV